MDLGKDIVQKIRSAVKSKLLDLGSYVDDELPDYVMVMVANKKSEAQMTEDLSLFLGPKTSKFTSWLHGLLNRLTSIGVDDPSSKNEVSSKSCSNSTNRKSSHKPSQESKTHLEPGVPEDVDENDACLEVLEPVISLKSERDYIDDIDRDDEEVEETASSKRQIQHPQENVTSSLGSSKVDKPPASRKRTREPAAKKEKRHHQSKNKVEQKPASVAQASEAQTQEISNGAFVQSTKVLKDSSTLPIPDFVTNSKDLKGHAVEDPTSAMQRAGNVSNSYDGEQQFYPYEISDDVEMIPVEFVSEDPRQSGNLADGGGGNDSQKHDPESVKSRKVLVSGRPVDQKPERKVSVLNQEGTPAFPAPLLSEDKQSQATNFIVTLDGAYNLFGDQIFEDDDVEDWDLDGPNFIRSPVINTRVHSIGNHPVVICDNADDEEDEEEEEDDVGEECPSLKRQKISERCRYWPKCKAGEECPYHHPRKPCKAFPNCRFKDKCLFIHPECKFNLSCTNLSCAFTHTAPRAISIAPPTVVLQPIRVPFIRKLSVERAAYRRHRSKQSLAPSQVQCKFFPNCVDMTCPFSHPKPCRYGLSCSIKNRCPFSHPILPSKEKLKWFAKG